MSDAVAAAAITALGAVIVAAVSILAPILTKLASRVKDVQAQVANDHKNADGTPLNLRDDLDEKHTENHGILLAIQRDVAWLMRRVALTDDRVDHLEDTARKYHLEDTARKYHPEEGATP